MPLKGTNIFAQLVELIDKNAFHQTVRKHNRNKHAKGFTCWEQLVSLMFGHLGKAQSLKEICICLGSSTGKLSHLGLQHGPNKSTLAYANEHRSYKIFEETFYRLLHRAQSQITGKHKFRFKNKLYSMDTTVIDLCLSMFDWARFRRTKGAVKLHMLLDHDGYLPVFAHITDGKTHEIRAAKETITRNFTFPKDSFIAFDRGFNDYELFWTALISPLLLKMLKSMAKYAWSMSNLVAMLRFNLFTYRDLKQWLDDPINTPPFVPDDQLALFG
jgi:hypothetical protein